MPAELGGGSARPNPEAALRGRVRRVLPGALSLPVAGGTPRSSADRRDGDGGLPDRDPADGGLSDPGRPGRDVAGGGARGGQAAAAPGCGVVPIHENEPVDDQPRGRWASLTASAGSANRPAKPSSRRRPASCRRPGRRCAAPPVRGTPAGRWPRSGPAPGRPSPGRRRRSIPPKTTTPGLNRLIRLATPTPSQSPTRLSASRAVRSPRSAAWTTEATASRPTLPWGHPARSEQGALADLRLEAAARPAQARPPVVGLTTMWPASAA